MTIPGDFRLGDDEDLDDLLMRYWLGEASLEEQRRIDAWFDQRPDHRVRFQQLYHGIETDQWSPLTSNVTAERAVNILRESKVLSANGDNQPSRRRSQRMGYWLGAVAAGFLLLAFGWLQRSNTGVTSNIATSYATGNGEHATVTLPDGSTVSLNVASRLDVSPDFGRGDRNLTLVGEALFTVIHAQGKPFTVTAGSHVTRVLGTSFIVRQYPTDTAVTIAVREGKVSVGSAVLTAGNEASIGLGTVPHIQAINLKRFGFTQGVLSIESRPLVEAIPELNRWFNADIQLGDSTLATRRAVGSVEIGSITDLMWVLQAAYNVRVVRDGRVLTLYPRG